MNSGNREVLGMDVITTEDEAGRLAFPRSLVARGLSGVQLVISDAHEGLKAAIESVLTGASWQRCRTHAMRNLLTRVRPCPTRPSHVNPDQQRLMWWSPYTTPVGVTSREQRFPHGPARTSCPGRAREREG